MPHGRKVRPTGRTEKAVAALEERWLRSQKENNPDLIASAVADKFVATQSDGKVIGKNRDAGKCKIVQIQQCRIWRCKGHRFREYGHSDGLREIEGNRFVGQPTRR